MLTIDESLLYIYLSRVFTFKTNTAHKGAPPASSSRAGAWTARLLTQWVVLQLSGFQLVVEINTNYLSNCNRSARRCTKSFFLILSASLCNMAYNIWFAQKGWGHILGINDLPLIRNQNWQYLHWHFRIFT